MGGSGEIGQAITKKLSVLGYNCIVASRGNKDLSFVKTEEKIEHISVDLADRNAIEPFVSTLMQKHKDIRSVVYCVGDKTMGSIPDLTDKEIDSCLDLNFGGFVRFLKNYYPFCQEIDERFSFIVLSSFAVNTFSPNLSLYSSTKAALGHFLANLRINYSNQGKIQFSTVSPGNTGTPADTSKKFIDPAEIAEMIGLMLKNRHQIHITNIEIQPSL